MSITFPKADYSLNYMLDTCALNSIADSKEHTKLIGNSILYGYRYYKTDVQERELNGVPDRTLEYEKADAWKLTDRAKIAKTVLVEIKAERVSCVAAFLHNFFVLDGSMRLCPDEGTGPIANMMQEIHNQNIHHMRDAMIAESAIYNNCILVTADKRLYKKVKKYFPQNVINYYDFIDEIKNLTN